MDNTEIFDNNSNPINHRMQTTADFYEFVENYKNILYVSLRFIPSPFGHTIDLDLLKFLRKWVKFESQFFQKDGILELEKDTTFWKGSDDYKTYITFNNESFYGLIACENKNKQMIDRKEKIKKIL